MSGPGGDYRLPTIAEWEFVASEGGKLGQQVAPQDLDSLVWYRENSEGQPQPVGLKPANALGFFDMFGNVAEWCFDRSPGEGGEEATPNYPCGDPLWQRRISKGGGYKTPSNFLQLGNAESQLEIQSQMGLGFRLAKGGVPPCEEEMKATFHYPAFEMVTVAGGTFPMGPDETGNITEVTLNSYQIGKFEVSQTQWEEIMGDNPSLNQTCAACPVETVSWSEVLRFIETLNAQRGTTYRLPTEAEWEFAARGGIQNAHAEYPGVDDLETLYRYGNCFLGNSFVLSGKVIPVDEYENIAPVGSFLPNALGIFDLAGNVWEFCQDWKAPYSTTAIENPQGPENGSLKVVRGGGWNGKPSDCNLSFRGAFSPSDPGKEWIGFRLARDL